MTSRASAMLRVAEIRVLYADTDQMGIVNNANYLRWFEIGRAEWLRHHGTPYTAIEQEGFQMPIVEAHLRYRAPAKYDDLVAISAQPAELRAASVKFLYQLHRAADGGLLCEGYTTHACLDTKGKVSRIPKSVVRLLGFLPDGEQS